MATALYSRNQGLLDQVEAFERRAPLRRKAPIATPPSGAALYADRVASGGLLTDAGAAANYAATGYMPRKTVGGAYGSIPNPENNLFAGGLLRAPREGFTDRRLGYEPMGAAMAARLSPASRGYSEGPIQPPSPEQIQRLFGSDVVLGGPNGTTLMPSPEARARRGVLRTSDGRTATGMNAAGQTPLEAVQAARDAAVADAMSGQPQTQRGLLTQRAMARSAARQERIAQRNAPPQAMGLLEQMALRDPRNAMALMQMQQQGLLAQQEMGMRGRQLDQQGLLAQAGLNMQGQRLWLDRELGMANADIQRQRFTTEGQRYEAELARQKNIDSLKFVEAANQRRATAEVYRQQGRFEEADREEAAARQLENAAGGGVAGGGPAPPYTPSGVPAGGATGSTGGGLLSPQAGAARPLTPIERQQFDAIKDDPEAVANELRRRGYSGDALNRELNKIYGSSGRSGSNPKGAYSWLPGMPFYDEQGREQYSLGGILGQTLARPFVQQPPPVGPRQLSPQELENFRRRFGRSPRYAPQQGRPASL